MMKLNRDRNPRKPLRSSITATVSSIGSSCGPTGGCSLSDGHRLVVERGEEEDTSRDTPPRMPKSSRSRRPKEMKKFLEDNFPKPTIRVNTPSTPTRCQRKQDMAPTQPSCSQTVVSFDETLTLTTLWEEEEEEGLDESFRREIDADVQAREAPNPRTPTVPVHPHHRILQRRKLTVQAFVNAVNSQHHLEEHLRALCTPDFQVVFRGVNSTVEAQMDLKTMTNRLIQIFKSLPDFRFMYRDICESAHADHELLRPSPEQQLPSSSSCSTSSSIDSSSDTGVMILQAFVGTGTHTGKAFVLAKDMVPIPAMGTLVVLDESESHYHFDSVTNKICRIEEFALGETTGLLGVHSLLDREY